MDLAARFLLSSLFWSFDIFGSIPARAKHRPPAAQTIYPGRPARCGFCAGAILSSGFARTPWGAAPGGGRNRAVVSTAGNAGCMAVAAWRGFVGAVGAPNDAYPAAADFLHLSWDPAAAFILEGLALAADLGSCIGGELVASPRVISANSRARECRRCSDLDIVCDWRGDSGIRIWRADCAVCELYPPGWSGRTHTDAGAARGTVAWLGSWVDLSDGDFLGTAHFFKTCLVAGCSAVANVRAVYVGHRSHRVVVRSFVETDF